jgi:hypothetical protein
MANLVNIGTSSNEYIFNTHYTPPFFRFNQQLDVDYLNNYYQKNISDAAFMFEVFLNCTIQKFYEFIASALSKDYSEAYRLAHQIIPTFKLVGLTDIAFQLDELENKVKQSYCLHSLAQSISTNFKKAIPIIFTQKAEIDSFLKQQKN